jgi:spermidine synthase
MLLYLTIGYFIGGRWADRSPNHTTLYKIVVWGAFLNAIIPLVAQPILLVASRAVLGAEAALALGSFFSVLILFSLPVTLLGCVSPFAIRLGVRDVTEAGKVSGRIYAISTLGSLLGTFLPVLVLTPEIGTIRTFLAFAGILYLVGFIGLWYGQRWVAIRTLWMPIVILATASIVLNGPLRPPFANAVLLSEDESEYNYIQVQEDEDGNRYLYLNEGQGIHSQWHKDLYGFWNGYPRTWEFFLTAPYFNEPPYSPDRVDSLLVIGLAGGTIARQYTKVYGNVAIDGIEIDPGVVGAGERYFGMDALPNLTIYVQDGRYMLRALDQQYRVVAIDAYRPPYIPWHLTTIEFFAEVKEHLTSDGVVAINVGRTNTDRRLVDAMATTMQQVFPSLHAMDVPRSFNTILVATMQETNSENLAKNLSVLPAEADPLLSDTLAWGANSLVPLNLSPIVFTDDRAPVETLVDSIVLNFLISGGTDQLIIQDQR